MSGTYSDSLEGWSPERTQDLRDSGKDLPRFIGSLEELGSDRKWLAEIGIKGLMVGLAHGAVRWRHGSDEVTGYGFVDAVTWVDIAGMAVSVEGQQRGVAEPLGGDHSVTILRSGVVAIADNKDGIIGGGVPRTAV